MLSKIDMSAKCEVRWCHVPFEFSPWWKWFFCLGHSNDAFLFPRFLERTPWRNVPMIPGNAWVRICGFHFEYYFPRLIQAKMDFFDRLLDNEFTSAPMPNSEAA